MYSYDRTGLNPVVESREESKDWTKEKIAFDASYGNERMAAYLFLPKKSKPPFQTVVYFPGADALSRRSSSELAGMDADFLVRSGRALLYPVYKSTYERGDGFNHSIEPPSPTAWRDHVFLWVKDLARSIDYLETRQDIDGGKLAYYGLSWGGHMGPICLALETRLRVGVLALGGFLCVPELRTVPEADQINFAPRVHVPVLMLNGGHDSIFPLESAQLPMFRFLGTPEEHKRHVIYDTGHFLPRNEEIKEALDWLDRYLGPIR